MQMTKETIDHDSVPKTVASGDTTIDCAGAGRINIEKASGPLTFYYPNTIFMKNLVMGVLNGEDYPIFNIAGYAPAVIWDVGANVGAAAIYFHLHFPTARICCYEPSQPNFAYLEKNTAGIAEISCYPWGLFDRLLARDYYLLYMCANNIHRGTGLYIAKQLAEAAGMTGMEIPRPAIS